MQLHTAILELMRVLIIGPGPNVLTPLDLPFVHRVTRIRMKSGPFDLIVLLITCLILLGAAVQQFPFLNVLRIPLQRVPQASASGDGLLLVLRPLKLLWQTLLPPSIMKATGSRQW